MKTPHMVFDPVYIGGELTHATGRERKEDGELV